MAIMAQWCGMTWEVSSRRIAALKGISASVKLDAEKNDDKAGSPATNTKALEPQTFNFEYDLAFVAGSDVRSEFDAWCALVGLYAPFYLAGQRLGPDNLQLTEVKLSNTTLDNYGRILKGTIAITLEEYAEEASSKKSSSSSSSSISKGAASAATYAELGITSSAASIGASSSDKATKKATNSQLTQ